MSTTVALLRGINVGGHRVKMDRLRGLFEEMGFADVSTFIASGNVLFTTDATNAATLAGRIEADLAEALGYEVSVFLRTAEELTEVAAFEESAPEHVALYVTFLQEPLPPEARAALEALTSDVDSFLFAEREVYWVLQCKMSESPLFGAGIERAFQGVPVTTRNMNTVRRLVARVVA